MRKRVLIVPERIVLPSGECQKDGEGALIEAKKKEFWAEITSRAQWLPFCILVNILYFHKFFCLGSSNIYCLVVTSAMIVNAYPLPLTQ